MKQPAHLAALLACVIGLLGCALQTRAQALAPSPQTAPALPEGVEKTDDGFIPLFNGEDLTGWTPKFVGHEAGVNYNNTFRVEDGLLTVDYGLWGNFNRTFGHLFYKTPFSHYILRVEYRFIGQQCPGGPGWAFMNSGVMFHGQSIESMGLNQDFPDSIEAQLLGQHPDNPKERPTGNVCSPGTHYVKDGKLIRAHCTSSSSKTYRGDQWVTFELEVHGHGKIIHRVNGEKVFEYEKPQLSGSGIRNRELSKGTISLQAESHPIQFKRVEIKILDEEADEDEVEDEGE